MNSKIPFYRKIVFKLFVLVFIVLMMALLINLILTNKMMDKRMEQRLINDFNLAYHTTENFINLVSQTSKMWAKEIVVNHFDLEVRDENDSHALSFLLNREKNKMSADTIILLNAQGYILAQSGSEYTVGDSLSFKDIVRQTFETKIQYTKIARETDRFIIYSSAIIKKNDRINGMLLVGYFINDMFVENIKKNTNLEIAFIGNSAVMGASNWGTRKGLNMLPISYLDYMNILSDRNIVKEIKYKNKIFMVNAKRLNNIESLVSGSLLFGYPYDKIKQAKDKLLNKKLIIFYLTTFFSLLLIYFIVLKYFKTINKLTQAMDCVSNNKAYESIKINTKDEIELLAISFNRMGTELNTIHSRMEKEIVNKTKALQELNDNLESKVILEVSRNRQKDQQLVLQSRLAQMGEMISMIAHQWRQPLAAISSTSTAINIKAKLNKLDTNTILELSDKITAYSQHLSSTIDDFREFFKPYKEKKETSYRELVTSVLNIIEVSIKNKNIDLITNLNCNHILYTYPNEIKQVLLNLIKNAEDILLEKEVEKPCITIGCYDNVLTVSDNGGGIPEDLLDKIFEPYFSTKIKKDGTGLGLYMSKTIIEEHCNGNLSVLNNKEGAVFKIVLAD